MRVPLAGFALGASMCCTIFAATTVALLIAISFRSQPHPTDASSSCSAYRRFDRLPSSISEVILFDRLLGFDQLYSISEGGWTLSARDNRHRAIVAYKDKVEGCVPEASARTGSGGGGFLSVDNLVSGDNINTCDYDLFNIAGFTGHCQICGTMCGPGWTMSSNKSEDAATYPNYTKLMHDLGGTDWSRVGVDSYHGNLTGTLDGFVNALNDNMQNLHSHNGVTMDVGADICCGFHDACCNAGFQANQTDPQNNNSLAMYRNCDVFLENCLGYITDYITDATCRNHPANYNLSVSLLNTFWAGATDVMGPSCCGNPC